jgi:hypothetical protein
MCDFQEPQTNGIRISAEGVNSTKADSKPKPSRFCASFAEYFSLDRLFKGFRPDDKNDSIVPGIQSNQNDATAQVTKFSNPADAAVDDLLRVENTVIRHSLSLGENTVRFRATTRFSVIS